MKFPSNLLARTALVSAVALGSTAANALSYDETASFASTAADWTTTLSLAKFNTSLGTLTGVTISFLSNVSADAGLDNEGAAFTNAQLTANLDFSVTGGPTGMTVTDVAGDLSGLGSTSTVTQTLKADSDGASNYTATGTTDDDIRILANYSYTKTSYVDIADLSFFSGAGLLSFDVSTAGGVTLRAPSNYNSYSTHTADALMTITYEYTVTPVPEPESYAMLLAGLAAIGVVARRRRVQG